MARALCGLPACGCGVCSLTCLSSDLLPLCTDLRMSIGTGGGTLAGTGGGTITESVDASTRVLGGGGVNAIVGRGGTNAVDTGSRGCSSSFPLPSCGSSCSKASVSVGCVFIVVLLLGQKSRWGQDQGRRHHAATATGSTGGRRLSELPSGNAFIIAGTENERSHGGGGGRWNGVPPQSFGYRLAS